MAAMAPEKTRSLHNFSLSPRLTWGSQKHLRCAKFNDSSSSSSDAVSDDPPPERKRRHPKNASFRLGPGPGPGPSSIRRDFLSGDDQIEAIREKLMLDLRSEVDKMRAAFLGNAAHIAASSPPAPPPPPPPAAELRPWNLRTRRAACKEPSASEHTKAPPPERGGAGAGVDERAKFSVALSRKEIEDDFVKMIGKRPPRKPKKRPRSVQRQMDTLFPGLWLSEITPDMYTVYENP